MSENNVAGGPVVLGESEYVGNEGNNINVTPLNLGAAAGNSRKNRKSRNRKSRKNRKNRSRKNRK